LRCLRCALTPATANGHKARVIVGHRYAVLDREIVDLIDDYVER